MTTLDSRWLAWQPSVRTTVDDAHRHRHHHRLRDDPSSWPNTSQKRTDKTDKSPSVSFVSAVSGHIAADDDQVAGAWDATDWQALYDERAAIREYDGELPRPEAERLALNDCIDWWLTQHPPEPTDDVVCVHCSDPLDDDAIPVLAGYNGHTWLHGRCHHSWLAKRRAEAEQVLAAMGVAAVIAQRSHSG